MMRPRSGGLDDAQVFPEIESAQRTLEVIRFRKTNANFQFTITKRITVRPTSECLVLQNIRTKRNCSGAMRGPVALCINCELAVPSDRPADLTAQLRSPDGLQQGILKSCARTPSSGLRCR